jgi:hypothetical protein
MSRTAEPRRWYQVPFIRLFFCLLIGCLAVHFLVEDALLFTEFVRLDPAAPGASQANPEEMEHLDDLVYAERIPENHADPERPAAFLWIAPSIRQAHLPIFKPPKS